MPSEPKPSSRELLSFAGLVLLSGVAAGAASALFLWLLDVATQARGQRPWIVYALPVAGLVIGGIYERYGQPIRGGNNLVVHTLREGGAQLPVRMAPMVLFGTVWTHLFGGSAGREGTAVQMGACLADWLAFRVGLPDSLRRPLLAAGVAAGFGSVFGTPLAGAVFGLEVAVLGRIDYRALAPALAAALIGDATTRALGIVHTAYPSVPELPLTWRVALAWLVFALVVAAVSGVFIELTQLIKRRSEQWCPRLPLRMAAGGVLLVALWRLVGSADYLGLGVPTIVRSFEDPTLPASAFALKLLFTALTLGTGFLGGEVTPLFFVGAALGNACAPWLGVPLSLAAGVGLAAMFATAAHTPLALSIMAVELLGRGVFPHAVVVCALAYTIAGRRRSIYPAQRGNR